MRALGESRAAVIGHDWGSGVAWTSALLRPDIFEAVALLSVPYIAGLWDGPLPTTSMKQLLASGQMLYQLYFQEPGRADSDLARNVRESMRGLFVGASGGIAEKDRWRFMYPASEAFLDTLPRAQNLPLWLTAEELDFFVNEFTRTGFTGGLNWYRNMDRTRELLAFLAGAKIVQPSTFIAGEEDLVIAMYRADYDVLEQTMPGLTAKTLIPGAGHWVQQEKPEEVSAHLLRFLAAAWPSERMARLTTSSFAAAKHSMS